MNSTVHFSPVFSLYWLLPAALLLMLALCWQESRKPYRFKALRVTAQILSVLSLLALLLRPSFDEETNVAGVVVLTEQYSPSTLDSLSRAQPGLRVVRAPGVDLRKGTDSIRSFRELETMPVKFVLGDGIPTPYVSYAAGYRFLPGAEPSGVVELSLAEYPGQRRNWLRGKVRGIKGSRLVLIGPGGAEDSVKIRGNALTGFELGFRTKIPGQYVYRLILKDSTGRNMSDEDLPVEVVSSRKLSVLLLQSYPTAEIRFLKNYLTEKGHGLVTRYQLSRNIFRYEVANGAQKPGGVLDGGKLLGFDLVIGDDASLKGLSGEETRALESSVRQGLGLLVLLNGLPEARNFPGNTLQLSLMAGAPDTVRYTLGSFGAHAGPFLGVKAGSRVQAVRQEGNYLLQGLVLYGTGKVGVQSLQETYRLALGGDNNAFAALWTPLLEQTARREESAYRFRLTSDFPVYAGDPVDFNIIGAGPPKVSVNGVAVPLAEDVGIDDLWRGQFWAGVAGWEMVTIADSVKESIYVSKPGTWHSLRTENQRRDNAFVVKGTQADTTITRRREIEPLIFFIVFLLCAAFTWVAPKL